MGLAGTVVVVYPLLLLFPPQMGDGGRRVTSGLCINLFSPLDTSVFVPQSHRSIPHQRNMHSLHNGARKSTNNCRLHPWRDSGHEYAVPCDQTI